MNTKTILIVIAALLALVAGVLVYQQSNQPQTTGEKIEAAMESASDDIGDAVTDVQDAVEDAADDIQENTAPAQ
jgi:outer membrane murein-binding lipoprotein Lpp